VIIFMLALVLSISPNTHSLGQGSKAPRYEVFFGEGTLYFIDPATGLSQTVAAPGNGHTLLGNGVIFQGENGVVQVAYPDGRVGVLAAIPAPDQDIDARWFAIPTAVVWVVNRKNEAAITSDVYLADARGENATLVLRASSATGAGIVPLALSNNGQTLFYARVADPFAEAVLYPSYGEVFRLDTTTGASETLSLDGRCPCAVGFSADGQLFAQLVGNSNGGFTLSIRDLRGGVDQSYESPANVQNAAGYVWISADGRRFFYSAQRPIGNGRLEYSVMYAEAGSTIQTALATGLRNPVRNIGFGGSAGLMIGIISEGTFKLNIDGSGLFNISRRTYLGAING
jgi:hypothetical protein